MAGSKLVPCLVSLILISLLVFPSAATPTRRKKSLDAIKSLNQKGPYIGLITVYPPEEHAFFATGAIRPDPRHPFVDLSGTYIFIVKLLFVCDCVCVQGKLFFAPVLYSIRGLLP